MCYWKGNLLCGLIGHDCYGLSSNRNTKYFHNCATKRYRENLIERIKDEDGIWKDQPNDIATILVNYYKTLFSSTQQNVSQDVLACVPTIIDDEMNDVLC